MYLINLIDSKNKQQFTQHLVNYFKTQQEIVAVYLFGSFISGNFHNASDIDIGILFKADMARRKRMDKVIYYNGFLDHGVRIDIVDMNSADYPILFTIFNEGKLFIENDHDARVTFESLKMSQYADFIYYENLQFKGLIKKFREGIRNG